MRSNSNIGPGRVGKLIGEPEVAIAAELNADELRASERGDSDESEWCEWCELWPLRLLVKLLPDAVEPAAKSSISKYGKCFLR